MKKIFIKGLLTGLIALNLLPLVSAHASSSVNEVNSKSFSQGLQLNSDVNQEFKISEKDVLADLKKFETTLKGPQSRSTYKENRVGNYIQSTNYTCGPAAARSAIYAYTTNVPSETTLVNALGTTDDGTGFSNEIWSPVMNNYAPGNGYVIATPTSGTDWNGAINYRVKTTVDKGYNVVANLNHGSIKYPIHPIYANGIAHYVTVYGYNNTSELYYVSDPNYDTRLPYVYQTPQYNMAESTKSRGIVW